MDTISKSERSRGFILLFATILFFSTYEVVNKMMGGRIDPFQINFIRFFVGGAMLLAVAAVKRELTISPRDFALCALAGGLNVVVSMSLINASLSLPGSSAAVTAVLFSCNPVFVSIFAALIDGERIGPRKVIALALGIAGPGIISLKPLMASMGGAGGAGVLLGPTLTVLSALAFGLYTVVGKRISGRIGSLRMNGYAFLTGSLMLVPFLLATGRPLFAFDLSVAPHVAYLSIFMTGIAYLIYFRGLGILGAGKGSLVFFLKPVLATAFAVLLLGESIDATVIGGMALILVAVGL